MVVRFTGLTCGQPSRRSFEGHELAFKRFGGVFKRLRYDNLKLAVKKILRGYRREETARFIAFRSHWRFEAIFRTPGIEHAHEKGGIEGEGATSAAITGFRFLRPGTWRI